MYDAFISYAREDRARVRQLADALVVLRGWSLWWDASVHTGDRFAHHIEAALAESRCVIVVWSRHSVASDWVRAEASEGWQRGVLVPLRFDNCEPPLPFRQTQTADLSGWRGSQQAPELLALVEDIQRMHARATADGAGELAQRQARQRAARRRRALRGLLAALAVLVLGAGSWLAYDRYVDLRAARARSVELAARADALRNAALSRTPEEEKTIWWYLLLQDEKRIDTLETSILLAVEAQRSAPGEEAARALRDGLMLLPWSDWRLELDDVIHVGVLRFSHDGVLLAAGGGGGDTLVWDYRAGEILARIAHGGTGTTDIWDGPHGVRKAYRGPQVLDYAPRSDVIATAGPDHTARTWNARGGAEIGRFAHPDIAVVVRFHPAGSMLASASADGSVFLWDTATGEALTRMKHADEVFDLDFSPAGDLLASASRDGSAGVWRVPSGELVAKFEHKAAPEGVRFTPDGALLATFGPEVETVFWAIAQATLAWRLPVTSAGNAGPMFAAGNDLFVLPTVDGELGRWSLVRQEPLFSVDHGGYIRMGAVDAGHVHLVTIGADETARAWAMDSGRELKRMPYAGWLTAAAVSPDGRLMATSGYDPWGQPVLEVTQIWPEDPVAAACAQLSRNLTRNEWREYLPGMPYRETCANIEER